MKKLNKKRIPLYILLALLLCGGLVAGTSYAKYKQGVMVTGSFRYYDRLAERFELTEHKAEADSTGAQSLGKDPTQGNTYYLIPGTSIPEDPYIEITNKSEIDSMLFIEVVGNPAPSTSDTAKWTLLDGVTGPNGGAVYSYAGDLSQAGNYSIPILTSAQAQSANPNEISAEPNLKIVGYLVQVADSSLSPAELFSARVLD